MRKTTVEMLLTNVLEAGHRYERVLGSRITYDAPYLFLYEWQYPHEPILIYFTMV